MFLTLKHGRILINGWVFSEIQYNYCSIGNNYLCTIMVNNRIKLPINLKLTSINLHILVRGGCLLIEERTHFGHPSVNFKIHLDSYPGFICI